MIQKVMIFVVVFVLFGQQGFAQKHFKETIQKELNFSASPDESVLVITNIFGPVAVEAHDGEAILLEVKREIFAKDSERLALGKEELELEVLKEKNRIVLRPKSPYIEYQDDGFKFSCCNDRGEPPYGHKLSFKVKVPKRASLNISTINDGDVNIKNTAGDYLKANNINGAIALVNVQGKTKVHSINGNVDISYAKNPEGPSEYYALNGDINVTYKKTLSAAISFKSFNGELFTDFDIEKQYLDTKKTTKNNGVAKFKYESTPVVQIGNGGTDFSFETFNGNVFIKKI